MRPTIGQAQKTLFEYLKAGFTDRAVVVPSELDVEAQLNPNLWGIVCKTDWFKPWPLQVKWINGQINWTKKEDVRVIWPGMNTVEARKYLEQLTSAVSITKQ